MNSLVVKMSNVSLYIKILNVVKGIIENVTKVLQKYLSSKDVQNVKWNSCNDEEHKFIVTWRCDEEDYYCTDSLELYFSCISIIELVDVYKTVLDEIESRNTIIKIEKVM